MDKHVKTAIEIFKTTTEYAKDFELYCKCSKIMDAYVRTDAIAFLNELIKRYGFLIDKFFLLFGGVHVIIIENYDTVSDAKIIEDISYIGVRIPFYAFIREGEKELARHVLDKVGCSDFVI